MNFENVVVRKPWGHERLLCENKDVGVWHLHINEGAITSFHSHPKKKTGLIVLSGVAQVSFMNGRHHLTSCDKIMIRNGVFHSTKALSQGLDLIEVETPNDKFDIIRLEDEYGRSGTPYEGEQFYDPSEQTIDLTTGFKIGDCVISQKTLTHEDFLNRSAAKIVILDGGIRYLEHWVLSSGDVVDTTTLTRFASKFETVPTTILEVKLITT